MRILMIHPKSTLQQDQQIFVAEQRLRTRIREAEDFVSAVKTVSDPEIKTDLILIHGEMGKDSSGAKTEFWAAAKEIPVVVYASEKPADVVPMGVEVVDAIGTEDFVDPFYDVVNRLIAEKRFETATSDHGFLRIRSRLLLSMRELKSDVFIRLSDQKFIKIFHEGDEFGDEDFEKYTQKKKVDFLYIRENESERFVGLYLKDLKKVVHENQSTVSDVVHLTEEGHQTVQDLIEKVGFTEAVQQITKDQVNLTVQAIQKIPDARALLAKMEETTGRYIPVHSSKLGIVASWFCAAMGWDSAETFTKLCLAAFLHDITLDNDELAKIKTTDELEKRKDEFRPDEIRAYKEHPMKAVELSRKIKSLPLEVDTILHQHHERYDSKGFPQRLNVRLITPLATAFNMAHDYVDYQIERGKDATLKEFLDMSESWYNQSHYKRIHRQLRTLT